MKKEAWGRRLAERSDMATSLIHLTKKNESLSEIEVLMKILKEKKLTGSNPATGFICGNIPAVCFQDTPLYYLSQNIYYEQKMRQTREYKKIRYVGVGLMFSKILVYKKGGRPVIYEKKEVAKALLPQSEHWRIVNYDLSVENEFIDWTHEREWRVSNDFDFELNEAIVILPKCDIVKKFIKEYFKVFKRSPYDDLKGIISLQELFI